MTLRSDNSLWGKGGFVNLACVVILGFFPMNIEWRILTEERGTLSRRLAFMSVTRLHVYPAENLTALDAPRQLHA